MGQGGGWQRQDYTETFMPYSVSGVPPGQSYPRHVCDLYTYQTNNFSIREKASANVSDTAWTKKSRPVCFGWNRTASPIKPHPRDRDNSDILSFVTRLYITNSPIRVRELQLDQWRRGLCRTGRIKFPQTINWPIRYVLHTVGSQTCLGLKQVEFKLGVSDGAGHRSTYSVYLDPSYMLLRICVPFGSGMHLWQRPK